MYVPFHRMGAIAVPRRLYVQKCKIKYYKIHCIITQSVLHINLTANLKSIMLKIIKNNPHIPSVLYTFQNKYIIFWIK